MSSLQMSTRLENQHNAPIVVVAKRNGFSMRELNVTIPGGGSTHVYWGDLNVGYNYSVPHVEAFPEGQETHRIIVDLSKIQKNEVIVFGFNDNGEFACKEFKGKFLARFRVLRPFVSPTRVTATVN